MAKTYDAIHAQLRKERGPAKNQQCSCGQPASDWAYQHTGTTLCLPDGSRPYSEDVWADYAPMCRRCHQVLDLANQPELAAVRVNSARKMVDAREAAYAQDPAYAFQVRSVAGKQGIAVAALKLVDHRRAISTLNHTAKRRCLECGKVSVRTGLGRHQQASGHTGWEDVA